MVQDERQAKEIQSHPTCDVLRHCFLSGQILSGQYLVAGICNRLWMVQELPDEAEVSGTRGSICRVRKGRCPQCNCKEMQKGKFAQKCRDAGTDLRQLEPFTPWANAAEREIKELKRGAGRKLISSKCPKRFWDYCLEFESYIRSHTARDIFKLDGRVPEALVSGETPDISEYCDFAWYQLVMYWHGGNAKFPEEPSRLGRYLGPSIGVGPAQTAGILIANGEVLDRSTFRSLTPAETENEELSRERARQWQLR